MKEWFSIDDLKNSHELKQRFDIGATDMALLEEKFEFVKNIIKEKALPEDHYIKLEMQVWDEADSDFLRQFKPPFEIDVILYTKDVRISSEGDLMLAPEAIETLVKEGKISRRVNTLSRN